jgi:hypothetical protein
MEKETICCNTFKKIALNLGWFTVDKNDSVFFINALYFRN